MGKFVYRICGHSRFLQHRYIIGWLNFIRRPNRATVSSTPDEPQKDYTVSDEPSRYTGSSVGWSAVCITNYQYSQN
jgi:hypothetical protein